MSESYYKVIGGERYDREILDIAEKSVDGQGDGRISIEDAHQLFEAIIDGNMITKIELKTLDYIKANFKFTPAALNWIDQQLASEIPQEEGLPKGYYKTIDGERYDRHAACPDHGAPPSSAFNRSK